ncbi:hypothetical protein F5884DRAFT_519873 [Xylogone sp. PMI_703]|nr:hypothetical protein F5884DRAFT_519873 [Xylogone sp. PMI_703]
MSYQSDSPLSITSSVAGILTFVVAIAAAIYVRLTYLRNADQEYFQVKASLSWYKTESTWMYDLVHANDGLKTRSGNETEYQMYIFVMEQLGKLEERLLDLLTETEIRATRESEPERAGGWTLVPQRVRFTTSIAMSWLPVRAKAMELVRQRDALGSRVLFAQMSLISSRVRDQEIQFRKREELYRENTERLEATINSQHEKLDRLEDLVYRLMHRSQFGYPPEDSTMESPKYEENSSAVKEENFGVTPSGTELPGRHLSIHIPTAGS